MWSQRMIAPFLLEPSPCFRLRETVKVQLAVYLDPLSLPIPLMVPIHKSHGVYLFAQASDTETEAHLCSACHMAVRSKRRGLLAGFKAKGWICVHRLSVSPASLAALVLPASVRSS